MDFLIVSIKTTNLEEDKYKSDEDIEKEFDDFKITDITVKPSGKSGSIDIEFPNAEEHVAGGNEEVSDSWIKYEHNGRIAFDNWYPEKVYKKLVEAIEEKIGNVEIIKKGKTIKLVDSIYGSWDATAIKDIKVINGSLPKNLEEFVGKPFILYDKSGKKIRTYETEEEVNEALDNLKKK